ncbi:BTAD domain-containing putative transcriptional regulator [Streptomyces sp. NPDC014870]|uniref:BTAD domain-containing putative transcriptional regulator n=1 Tax=Streptomyces sp. NPDC014870 TaxID=3364925 RepID=UPI0036F6D1F3
MRYRVLGPCEALRADGGEAVLSGARLRALLAALASAVGRTVRVDELIGLIWEGEPPGDGTEALQALVGRLRRALGREAVVSVAGGYRLAAGAEDVDLYVFERLAAEGGQALATGQAEQAALLLDQALALWRGPALADLPGRDGDPLVVRVEQRHAQARKDRLAAEVALGRAEEAVAPLEALAAERPLDETVSALRIRALRAAGRGAEALRVYEEVRTVLADRLGADPGAELRALHADLLAGDGSLFAPAQRKPQPQPQPQPALPLPARPTSFVGREQELDDLVPELELRRLVTLIGPGGVGKTRLALEAADAGTRHRPDGTRFAELASVRSESEVAAAVLTAIGGRETQPWGATSREALTRLVEHCGSRRLLLLLDNCEHVVGAAAELVEVLLARCPGVTVLATSREPLGVPGEFVRPLEPLPQDKALRLLADRGAAARPGFDPAGDPEACGEICRRLDGLPLAIELAAARLRVLSPRQLADRLDDRFRLLTSGARTVLPRQQTLRAVVDWSWDLLTEPERAVLRRLSVFSGGCDLEAAEAVCPPGDTLDLLGSLVDKSLVVAAPCDDGHGGGMRYRLLETVAEYAGERLEEAGDRAETERRHLVHYRELARHADPALRGPDQPVWLGRLETEHGNVTAALRTAVGLGAEQEALCLVLSMSWFWQLRARQTDARLWSRAAAALGPDPFAPPVRHAVPLTARCTDAPPPWSEEQLWEARRGCALVALAAEGGEGAKSLERPEIRAHLDAIVAAYRPGMPQNCRQPGTMWFFARLMTGEFDSLEETLDAVLSACRAEGLGWELAFTHLMRAKLLGDRPADADAALAHFERVGDPWGTAESRSARGEARERSGRLVEAAADYEQAARAAAGLGAHAQATVFTARLAAVRLRLPATDTDPEARAAAERLLVEAAADASAESSGEPVSTARLLLAQHYAHTGRTALAREQVDRMQAEFSGDTPDLFLGVTGGLRGWLDCLDGAYADAAVQLTRVVRDVEGLAYLVAPHLLLGLFPTAAWARAGRGGPGDAEDGARLLGAYDAHPGDAGGAGFRPFTEQTESSVRAHAEHALRRSLDPATYARRYEEGARLSVREAATLV